MREGHERDPDGSRGRAHRESRYQWWVTNDYGYAGLYQFGLRLRATPPYRRYPTAPLAAMGRGHGGYHHWTYS